MTDERDAGELAEVRRELRQVRWYVDSDQLRDEISAWIEESHDQADADTAAEWVERQLSDLLAEYDMYHAPGLQRGEEGFPDRCEDCRHYGSACPVLRDDVEVRWRERRLEQASTEQEARRIYRQQATDVSCQLIPELLEEWDEGYSAFVKRGQQLLARAEEEIRDPSDGSDDETDESAHTDARSEATPAAPDGGDRV